MRIDRLRISTVSCVFLALVALIPQVSTAAPEGLAPIDLAIQLDDGTPNPVASGGSVTWNARVNHVQGADTVSSGELSITFSASSSPAGVVVIPAGTNWSCASSTCTYMSTLKPGATTTDLTILGNAPVTGTPGTIDLSVFHSISSGFVFDINSANDSASNQVQIAPAMQEDFFIDSIDATPDPAFSGELVVFTLVVGSVGSPSPAEGLSFQMDFDLSSTLGDAFLLGPPSGTGWSCTVTSCNYTQAVPPGGFSNPLTIQTAAGSPGTMTLDALITSDGSPGNNAGQRVVTVIDGEDYAFNSVVSMPDPIVAGAQGTVDVNIVRLVTKRGLASNPVISFSLSSSPAGASIVGTPGGTNWSCTPTDCTYVGPFLPSNTPSPTLTFTVQAPPSGPGTMALDMTLSDDFNNGNNSATATFTVDPGGPTEDFRISSITGAPNPIDPAASGSFEVQIERFAIPLGAEGTDGLTQPVLNYSLASSPAGATIVGTPSGNNWSCTPGTCTYTGSLPINTPTPALVFDVLAQPNGPGDMTLSVMLADDANNNNNTGSATLNVNPNSQLDYFFSTFSGSPNPSLASGELTFEVAVGQTTTAGTASTEGTSSSLSFEYSLSGSPGTPGFFGNPMGTNWNCGAGVCVYLGSLSDGQTTPSVLFSVQAGDVAPGEVTLQATLFGDDISSNNDGSSTVDLVQEDTPPVLLTLDKSAPGSAQVNQDIVYTLTVSNVGQPAATGLILTDNLPIGMRLISVDQGDFLCSSNPTTVNCTRDVLGAGQQAQMHITVQADEPGDYLNEAQLSANDLSVSLSDTALTQIEGVEVPFVDLVLTKTDSIDPVAPGAPFSYSLTVTNLGTQDATGVTITETFPEGMVLFDARGTNWSCSALNVCTLGISLGGGQSSTLTLDVLAPTSPGTITNRAEVRSLEVEVRPEDNSASEQTVIAGDVAVADLRVQADFGGTLPPNTPRPVNVIVQNNGPNIAVRPVLTGSVSGSLSLDDVLGQGIQCTINGNSFSCQLPTLEPEQSLGLGVIVRSSASNGSGRVSVEVGSETTDPQLGNNSASADVVVITAGTDLAVELSDSVDPVARGASFDYRLRLINNGPATAEQASLAINLDPSLTVTSQSTPGLTCTPANATAQTCSLSAPLLASSIVDLSFSVQVPLSAPDTLSASATVTTSQGDPNSLNNSASESTAVDVASEETIRDQLDDATLNDPIAGPAVNPTAERCANPDGEFADFCDQILAAPPEEVREALAALAPEENLAQATVLRELSFAQFFNIDARLAELRGAGGGFSTAGLNLSSRTGSLGFDQLTQMLGGDGRQADDAGGLFSSPWGFFINGTISTGDQSFNGTSGQVGVDFESRGLTAGVDYRFSPALVVGAALGYARFDSDITGDSQLDTNGFTLTGYGSWYPYESFYLDGRVSFGKVELEQSRRVRFTLNGQTTDLVARGTADADQFSFAVGAGYHLNSGAWNFTPNASIRYTNSDIDGFTERGAGSFALTYDSSSTDAVVASAGMQLSRAISLSRGVVTPQLSLSWNFENRGDDLAVTGRFSGTNGSEAFRFVAPETDSNYGALGLGFVFIGANGVQAYVNYRTVFGYEDFDRDTLNLGARFEF